MQNAFSVVDHNKSRLKTANTARETSNFGIAAGHTSLSIGAPSSVYHESERKHTRVSGDKERGIQGSAEG